MSKRRSERRCFNGWQRLDQLRPEDRLRLEGLTPRESEAALLVGHGLVVREIAEHMQVSRGTVQALVARARGKLDCQNMRELRTILIRERVILPEELPDPHEWRPSKPRFMN